MADAEQPPAKRSRFDSSNGQAASGGAAPGAVPVKPANLATAQAAMERAKAALERKKALDAKLKASKVTCCTLQPAATYAYRNVLCTKITPAGLNRTQVPLQLASTSLHARHCAGPVSIRSGCCCFLEC